MDLLCTAVTPLADLTQNLLDVSWTFLAIFGVRAPDVRGFLSGLTGCFS